MKVIVANDYEQMSRLAADILSDVVKNKPNAVLGLATGSSPIGMYDFMVADHKEKGISYKGIKTVNLDEYVGLSADHEQSYAYFMHKYLFDRVDIDDANTNLPNGTAKDKKAECDRYNALLDSLIVDVQVLGIGSNGHIGFNEPGTSFDSVTHVVNLTENTIKDNSRLFENINQVPRQAFSMGIKNIMASKKIVILASGKNKAKAIAEMVNGEVTTSLPASILQNHEDVVVIVDKEAGALLK